MILITLDIFMICLNEIDLYMLFIPVLKIQIKSHNTITTNQFVVKSIFKTGIPSNKQISHSSLSANTYFWDVAQICQML